MYVCMGSRYKSEVWRNSVVVRVRMDEVGTSYSVRPDIGCQTSELHKTHKTCIA